MDLTSASTERSALSCLFRSRDAWLSVADGLSEEDFSFGLHRQLYHAACICHERKLTVDPVVLSDKLGETAQKELEGVGGWAYLKDLFDTPISPANVGELARELRELTLRRRTQSAGTTIQKLAVTERDIDQMLGKAQVAVDGINAQADEGVVRIGDDLAWNLQQKIENASLVPGLPSGFTKLDTYLQGFQPGELYVLGARKKCHAAGTPILMFDGTIKPVEQVRFGDLLMGPDSRPRKILQLVQGTGAMREIIPSKGQPFRVNLDHLLTLQHQTTGEVIDISVRDWQLCTPKFQVNFRLIGTAVNFQPSEDPLTIDPYWLGVLLGDGHLAWGQQVTTHDPEIVEYGQAYAEQLGLKFVQHDDTICLTVNPGAKNPLREWLKELGLLPIRCEDRFVPHRYKVASREDRLAILAGLIDTDGSLGTSTSGALAYDYISKSNQLADDVAFLARSLGLWADVSPCLKRCGSGPHDRYFRVYISGDLTSVPVRIARKKAVPTTEGKAVLRRSFKVTAVPNSTFYGFVLDGDQRYLMGDFTITHNCGKSVTMLTIARHMALRNGTPILYISTEHHHKLDQLRLLSMESEVPFNLLNSGMVRNQPAQMERVTEAVGRIEQAPFHFKHLPSFDLGKIKRLARRYIRLEGVRAVYFDLIKAPQGQQSQTKEWQELGTLAYGLKELAGEEGVPLLSAVQFNREGASAQRLGEDLDSDYFAGSDRIAQALTVAFALRRPYKDELADLGYTEEGVRILQVTDNRLGPSGYKGILQFESSTLNLRELQRLA